MPQVFISYSKSDRAFAAKMQSKLKDSGLSVWLDVQLNAGDDWRQEIDRGIKESSVLIVIMSPQAKASEYVTYEWAFAIGARIRVIPVLYKKTELHPRLESLQYLAFKSGRPHPWEELVRLVNQSPAAKPDNDLDALEQSAAERMHRQLNEKGYAWRKIETLAKSSRITKEKAFEILQRDPKVEFAKSRTGEDLARLGS